MLEDILYGLLTLPFFSKPLTGFSLNPIISHVFTQQATMEGRHSVSLHYCLPTSLWKVDRQLYNRENASLLLGIIKITSHSRANQSILVALSKRFMDQNRRMPLLQRRCHFDFLGFTVRNLQRNPAVADANLPSLWPSTLVLRQLPQRQLWIQRDSSASSPAFTTPCTRELVLFLGMDLTFDWVCFSWPSYLNLKFQPSDKDCFANFWLFLR